LLNNFLYRARLRILGSRSGWGRREFDVFQNEQLLKTLKKAVKSISAYNGIKVPSSAGEIKDFMANNLPVITKKDLLNNRALYYPHNGIARPWAIIGKTSGTTGTPLDLFRSYSSIIWENAFIRKHWSMVGEEGYRRATLRGDLAVSEKQVKPPFWMPNKIDNQLIFSSRHLKPHFIRFFTQEIKRFSPKMLQAYPSTAFVVAEYLEKNDSYLDVAFVYTASEMLYPYQRELIEKRLGRVVDFYGMAERVAMATECLEGNLHINSDYSYVEILDENDEPTDDEGYVVGTTFHNFVMPLIRYKLSDKTKWKKGKCKCGSAYPMIEKILGKYEDRIFDGDDVFVSPSLITFAFKGVSNIEMAQVAQINQGEWEIRLVPSNNYSSEDGEKILINLLNIVSRSTIIKIRLVENIARTTAGKFRWVINEWVKK